MTENIDRDYVKDTSTAIRILPDFDGIPDELKERHQWIMWSAEPSPDGGKPRKVPRHARGYRIATTKPENYMSFEEARAAYLRGTAPRPPKERAENPESSEEVTFAGIGFVFNGVVDEDGLTYVGVDIDDCLIDGELSDLAVSILDATTTYVELSPRGTGIHLIARAKPLCRGLNSKNLGLETYSSGRYFTITGQQPFGCETRATVTEEVEAFDNVAQMIADDLKVPKDFPHSGSQSQAWDWSVGNLPTREHRATGNETLYVDSPKAQLANARAAAMAIVGKRRAPGEAVPFTGHDPRTFLGFAFANFAADHPELADEAWEAYFAVSQAAGNDAARDEQWWDETMRGMANGSSRPPGRRRTIASIFALYNEEERKGSINPKQVTAGAGKDWNGQDEIKVQNPSDPDPDDFSDYTSLLDAPMPEPREWVFGTELVKRDITIFGGAGGGGKTSRAVSTACAIAADDNNILGPDKKIWVGGTPVLYISSEDSLAEMTRRFKAAAKHFNLSDEAQGRIIIRGKDSKRPIKLTKPIATNGRGVLSQLNREGFDELERAIAHYKPSVVFLDPLQTFVPTGVNDGPMMGELIAELKTLAEKHNLSICIVHHMRKGNGEAKTVEDIKGGSEIKDHARVALLVVKMSRDEAKDKGVPSKEMWRYFRLGSGDAAKQNMSPPVEDDIWYQLISVELNNGNTTYPNGDKVQVATIVKVGEFATVLSPEDLATVERSILAAVEAAWSAGEPYGNTRKGGSARYWDKHIPRLVREKLGNTEVSQVDLATIIQKKMEALQNEGAIVEAECTVKKAAGAKGGSNKRNGLKLTPNGEHRLHGAPAKSTVEEPFEDMLASKLGGLI